MARITALTSIGVFVALAAAASGVGADGPVVTTPRATTIAYPVVATDVRQAPVYGAWTTPQNGGYRTWTTSQPSGYGTWTTSQPAPYQTWTTSRSGREPGARTVSVPASASVASPAPSTGWSTSAPIAAADPCGCSPWRFGAFARYWHPQIRGDVLITRGGVPGSGTAIDVDDDLDLEAGDGFEGGVSVAYRRHRVTLAYESDSFSGASRLDRSIVYRGAMFAAGTEIESDIDLTFWKLGYDYAFVDGAASSSALTLRGGLAAWLWKYEGRIVSATPPIDMSRDFSHVLPVATVVAEGEFGWLRAGARLSGGWLASDRYVVDAEASIGAKLWNRVAIDVGYRWMNLSFDETTNEADLTLYGPFAGIAIEL